MVKPLSEINSEFEFALIKEAPQNQPAQALHQQIDREPVQWQPVAIPKYTLQRSDSQDPNRNLPQQEQINRMPDPDQVVTDYSKPPDLIVSSYSWPPPDLVVPNYSRPPADTEMPNGLRQQPAPAMPDKSRQQPAPAMPDNSRQQPAPVVPDNSRQPPAPAMSDNSRQQLARQQPAPMMPDNTWHQSAPKVLDNSRQQPDSVVPDNSWQQPAPVAQDNSWQQPAPIAQDSSWQQPEISDLPTRRWIGLIPTPADNSWQRPSQAIPDNSQQQSDPMMPDYSRNQSSLVMPESLRQKLVSVTPDNSRQQPSSVVPDNQQPASVIPNNSQQPAAAMPNYLQQPAAMPNYSQQQSAAVMPNYSQQPDTMMLGYSEQQPNAGTPNFLWPPSNQKLPNYSRQQLDPVVAEQPQTAPIDQQPPQQQFESTSRLHLQNSEQTTPEILHPQNGTGLLYSQPNQPIPNISARMNTEPQLAPMPLPNNSPEQEQSDPRQEKNVDTNPRLSATNKPQKNGNNRPKNRANQNRRQDQNPVVKPRSLWLRIADWLFYATLIGILIGVFIWSRSDRDAIWINDHTVKNVLTGSMEPEIPQGALIIINRLNPSELQVGDDITFAAGENITFTHRILSVYENYSNTGGFGFQTYGINNDSPDEGIVTESNVVGRVVHVIPFVGNVVTFMQVIINNAMYLALILGFIVIIWLLSFAIRGLLAKPSDEKETQNEKLARNKGKKKKKIIPEPVSTANT